MGEESEATTSPAEETPDTGEVEIGGITFVRLDAADLTAEHRGYTMAQIGHSGLRPVADYARIRDPDHIGMAIMGDVWESGRAWKIVAAVLRRKGRRWSPKEAAANALIFAGATGKALDQLTRILGLELLGLFAIGTRASRTSPTSSDASTNASPTDDSSEAQPTTTASGTGSSADSRREIPGDSEPSPVGPSVRHSSPIATSPAPMLESGTAPT